jgi:hypothetical protein
MSFKKPKTKGGAAEDDYEFETETRPEDTRVFVNDISALEADEIRDDEDLVDDCDEKDDEQQEDDELHEILENVRKEAIEDLGPLPADVQQHAVVILTKVCHLFVYYCDADRLRQAMGLARHVALSDQVRTAFKNSCKYVKIDFKMLLRPVATRWNTHCECFQRQLEMKPAINHLCSAGIYRDFRLHKYGLTESEWKILEEMQAVLTVSSLCVSLLH